MMPSSARWRRPCASYATSNGAVRRSWSASPGRLAARVRKGKEEEGVKFADYFDFAEAFTSLPSHRILAAFRGEKEEILDLTVDPEDAEPAGEELSDFEFQIARHFGIGPARRPPAPCLPPHLPLAPPHPLPLHPLLH